MTATDRPRARRAVRIALHMLLGFGVLEACSAVAIAISNRLYGPQLVTRRSIITSQDSEIDRLFESGALEGPKTEDSEPTENG